jgi:hypothetical protein
MKKLRNIQLASALAFGIASLPLRAQERLLLRVERSEATFLSEAPLERITATNTRCTGLVDPMARTFAVQVPIAEFQGFNSPLQKEHFNENYLESRTWPTATFAGRIIEAIDLEVPGTYAIRAKGTLKIHGVEQERIIPCTVVVSSSGVRITADFEVPLSDHDIRIPRVVQQKIAPVIQVKLDLLFKRDPGS